MNKYDIRPGLLIVAILIIVGSTMVTISSATTVELVNPEKLPTQLREGEQTSLTLKIEDYEKVNSITISTSLVLSDNKPLYDFGGLNPSITESRYNQTITIPTSLLPKKEFQVSIYGKAPVGTSINKVDGTDIVVRKFSDSNKKYYDVFADGTSVDVNSFGLIIKAEEDFATTIEKVKWEGLEGVKKETTKLFYRGLTSEAQNIANEMMKIDIPNYLSLFGVIDITRNLWLNIVVVISIIGSLIIGYAIGVRSNYND